MSKRTTIEGRSVSEGAARVYYAIRAARHSPTNEQLGAATGYRETMVTHKLNELEAAGLITRHTTMHGRLLGNVRRIELIGRGAC